MIVHFDEAEKKVHFPEDRRLVIRLATPACRAVLALVLMTVGAAWIQYLFWGLPDSPSVTVTAAERETAGFPLWLRMTHWVNFFFMIIMIRSGLSILVDHPRLYWNNGCRPDTEWLKFTPVDIPKDKVLTAKDDARYISPIAGLPGYRHTVGIARCWHFLSVPFFIINGLIFVFFLFATDHWKRLVPTSWQIVADAWNIFVHYATFHWPEEPNGFYQYNALQQLSYFGVVFILPPIAMVTGLAMSPAIENRFHWLPRLFGSRQGARSGHFLVMLAYLGFLLIHVTMVAATGLVRNMNHITRGTDNSGNPTGVYIGLIILAGVVAFAILAHWLSWNRPRWLQLAQARINGSLWARSINKFRPRPHYTKDDITPYFWPNGKMPESEEWKRLAEGEFKDYKLKVGGLVEHPREFSLEELRQLGEEQSITMHHCIQGWSGIAEWKGVPVSALVAAVKPLDSAREVAFYSFGDGLYGGRYYDTHTLENCLKPGSILAWEMNYQPLPELYGAPLRLRVENQLGYKMVKWISSIEFIESHTTVGKGYGGKNEDDEYFDLLANT